MKKIFEPLNKSKKTKIIIITFVSVCVLAAVIIILFSLNANPIVGKWCYSEGRSTCYNFNADQTGTYDMANNKANFTYTTNDGILHVNYESENIKMADAKYRIENDVLILTTQNEQEVKYIKEEPKIEQPNKVQEQQDNQTEKDEEIEPEHEEAEKEYKEIEERTQKFQQEK